MPSAASNAVKKAVPFANEVDGIGDMEGKVAMGSGE
jgi:hypothetical protein